MHSFLRRAEGRPKWNRIYVVGRGGLAGLRGEAFHDLNLSHRHEITQVTQFHNVSVSPAGSQALAIRQALLESP